MIKLNIIILVIYFTFFVNTNVLVSEEQDAEYLCSAAYYVIEKWQDIPLFCLDAHFDRNKERAGTIIVWENGRIAWEDITKTDDKYFFTETIQPAKIKESFRKITKLYNEPTPFPRRRDAFHSIPMINTSLQWCGTYSQLFFKVEFWSNTILDHYEQNKDILITASSDKQQLVKVMENFEKPYAYFDDKTPILLDYQNHFGPREVHAGSLAGLETEDKYEYYRQFCSDINFFNEYKNVIWGLVPKERMQSSLPQKIIQKYAKVYKYKESDKDCFIFVQHCPPCPTGDRRPENGASDSETGTKIDDESDEKSAKKGETEK